MVAGPERTALRIVFGTPATVVVMLSFLGMSTVDTFDAAQPSKSFHACHSGNADTPAQGFSAASVW
jgi:hypothetical protein